MKTPVTVKLRAITWAAGFPEKTVAETTVYGFLGSAGRSEFYSAKAAGYSVTNELELRAESYNGQQEVDVDGVIFSVVREYRTNPHTVILSLQRR